MKRRPQENNKTAISYPAKGIENKLPELGVVLSGGGSRAAYQVGALRALIPYYNAEKQPVSVIVGSSIGAVNSLLFAACLKNGLEEAVNTVEALWLKRTFRNTFSGSPSRAFLRAVRVAALQKRAPGPFSASYSIFDPTPLMTEIDEVISSQGGLSPDNRIPSLHSVAVMTTIEGIQRKPLLFLSSHKKVDPEIMRGASFEIHYIESMTAKHGFASAALPSVLPPVEIDTDAGKIKLVDGGISQNHPVDPAVRLGAEKIIMIDVSGRDWWFDRFGEAHDTRPSWEVPAGVDTFCLRPPELSVYKCQTALGMILKSAVGGSTRKFMRAVGPVWPLFSVLKNKLGEDVAFEVLSYAALDYDYIHQIIETGYNETMQALRQKKIREAA
jgi:predicted acylesterase/phospholipase RssA